MRVAFTCVIIVSILINSALSKLLPRFIVSSSFAMALSTIIMVIYIVNNTLRFNEEDEEVGNHNNKPSQNHWFNIGIQWGTKSISADQPRIFI